MAEHHEFGKTSLKRMEDMHPDLARVFHKALKYSQFDFGVTEVKRSVEQQRINIAKGVSWSMDSQHFPDEDGLVWAGDIAVYVEGKITWEGKYYRKVMQAFIRAAIEEGVQVEFGGLWLSVEDYPHIAMVKYG